MKTLYLVRHAKSSWKVTALNDFQRPLKTVGIQDAIQKALRLKQKDVTPDAIITSPAIRALNTAILFAQQLSFTFNKIKLDKKIYEADCDTLEEIISTTDDSVQSLMLVGHNNGISEMAHFLCDEFRQELPTAGVVCLKLTINRWSELRRDCGKISFIDFESLTS